MIARSRYTIATLLLAVLAPMTMAHAQERKPVALLSVSSIDSLLGNIGYLSEAGGAAEAGGMVTMMANAYLEGIDRANPVGMILYTDGEQFSPLGFVPVKDLDRVLASLEETVGAARDLGNGIKEIQGFPPLLIKEKNGYAFIGQQIEALAELPENPAAMLDQLPKEYDIAIQGNVQNVPAMYLDMAIGALQDGVQQGLQQLPAEERAAQEEMIEAQLKQMETYIKESDRITIGWKTSPAEKRTYLDMTFTAVPGGALAKQMNAMANAKSDFTGFLLPDAAFQLNITGEIPKEQIQSSIEAIGGLKETALKEIEKDDNLEDPEARQAAKEMLGAALDIFVATIKTGKMDGAASIVLTPGDPSFVGGFHVADGKDIEKILRRVQELAKDEPDFPGINFNADKLADVDFHTVTVPIPEDEEGARKALGEKMELAVGVGTDAAYLGFGQDCVGKLKNIINSQQKQQAVSPFQLTVAVTPIMEFVSSIEDNPLIGSATDALKQAGGKDHVSIAGIPVKNGFTYRLEIEEGVLRAIGEAVKMARGGGF